MMTQEYAQALALNCVPSIEGLLSKAGAEPLSELQMLVICYALASAIKSAANTKELMMSQGPSES